jgi:hypothetical protein
MDVGQEACVTGFLSEWVHLTSFGDIVQGFRVYLHES